MNILIVGNGFDLSHYLPTKYDHFMVAMGAIENWHEQKGEMEFDDLFGSLYEKENYFFKYTKAMYQTDEIKISVEQITELKQYLKENVWYQYFSDHVREVKTWIDFENKIEIALDIVANFINKLMINKINVGNLSSEVCFYGEAEPSQIFLTREYCKILALLRIVKEGYFLDEEVLDEYGEPDTISHDVGDPYVGDLRFYINSEYMNYQSGFSTIREELILNFLQTNLDNFIEIFNQFLYLIINNFDPKNKFKINEEWFCPDFIYSFNYTNTYMKFYRDIRVEYLHGNCGREQNIVLGISDLNHENLKKLKAYGFTKYHQKLIKDTDYLFLDGFKENIEFNKVKVENFDKDFGHLAPNRRRVERQNLIEEASKLNLSLYIWGHSLDISDKDYIFDLFSLNDGVDRNVRVTVYYFDRSAKFSLLNNLLAILGKDKVEFWMKRRWLKFEPNPNVVEINNIEPVDLPKFG